MIQVHALNEHGYLTLDGLEREKHDKRTEERIQERKLK